MKNSLASPFLKVEKIEILFNYPKNNIHSNKMTILNDLKQFTYVMCYDCSSSHIMTYYENDDDYECEECYKKIKFDAITFEDPTFCVDGKKLETYILFHSTPKKVIKIFLNKIMKCNRDWIYDTELLNKVLDKINEINSDDIIHILTTTFYEK